MGLQTGFLGITGSLGGLVFKKDGTISTAPPKRKVMAIRTLENNTEFGVAASASKTFRDSFRQVMANIADKLVTSRMTKVMRAVIATDAVNDRGQRGVIDAEIELVSGFEFNEKAISSTIIFCGHTPVINRVSGAHKIDVDAFNAQQDFAAPVGTTHIKLVGSVSSIDFEAKESENNTVSSAAFPYKMSVVPAFSLELPLTPASVNPIALVFGAEFYQETNGKLYILGNGAYTTAKVVMVDGGV